MRIVSVGRVAPPFGGVCSFTRRLKQHMDLKGIKNVFFEISGIDTKRKAEEGYVCTNFFAAFIRIFFYKKSLVIFHSTRPLVLIGAALLKVRHNVIVFVHGEACVSKVASNIILRSLMRLIDYYIVPTDEMKAKMIMKCPKLEFKIVSTPFILFSSDRSVLSDQQCIRLKEECDYVIGVYAFRLLCYKGQDLYGLDMSIELIKALRDEGYNVGLIMLLPDVSNDVLYQQLLSKINEYGLDQYIIRMEYPLDDASILYRFIDLYVRPTNTDGDAFSIWESLYAHTPVIASDAVVRPESCILFHNRSQSDMNEKTKMVIDNYRLYKDAVNKIIVNGNEVKLLEMLEKFAGQEPV